jgi:alpha-ketoglutarate-dependent taurine dioxygenase
MIYTEPIEWPGLQSIKDNAALYREKFLTDKILAFRGANLSYEEQEDLTRALGDILSMYPNSTEGAIHRYVEDHSKNMIIQNSTGDDLVLNWHVEHTYFKNPIVAGTWNNLIFTTDTNNGKTYFYDTVELFKHLPEDWKDFLSKCIGYAYDYNHRNEMNECCVLYPHWLTNETLLRHPLERLEEGWHRLKYFEGRTPTAEESKKYLEIVTWIKNKIETDEDNRIVHKWQQGDVIIPDLLRLAHAVTGGFDPAERKFTGLWSYQQDTTKVGAK